VSCEPPLDVAPVLASLGDVRPISVEPPHAGFPTANETQASRTSRILAFDRVRLSLLVFCMGEIVSDQIDDLR
jgi:hypothetical protein